MFCLYVYMSDVISIFKRLRVGSHVCAIFMLFLCVIVHPILSGKSLQLLCILPFGMLCLAAISMLFVQIMWQCVCLYGDLSENGLCLP